MIPVGTDDANATTESWRTKVNEMSPMERKERGRALAKEVTKAREIRESQEAIVGKELTRFRSVAARINYVAQDRVDLKIAAMKVCKCMSSPMTSDWKLVERIARYLKYRPIVRCVYRWQDECLKINAFSDSDWAGDRVSRRSTTGGCLMRGAHAIKCWAKNQHVIALSSGEAELYACVKASSEAVGLKSMMEDMGLAAEIDVHVDANAAIGMIMKEGLSGVRHIDTQFLWVQEAVRQKRMKVKKVDGKSNPADMFTKALSSIDLEKCLKAMDFVY